MGHSPYYPDDVTDEMIDRYFGNDDNSCCKYCSHYYSCDSSCSRKENSITADEAMAMSDEEFAEAIHTDPDDWCDDFDPELYDEEE